MTKVKHRHNFTLTLNHMLYNYISSKGLIRDRDVPRGQLEGRLRRTTNPESAVAVNADQPWSIPFTTRLNNFLSNVYTTKYVQNICQTEQRRILATSYIISFTAGILALPILSWWLRKHKQRRQACENVCTVNAGRAICRYQNNLHGTNSNRNTYGIGFCMYKPQV